MKSLYLFLLLSLGLIFMPANSIAQSKINAEGRFLLQKHLLEKSNPRPGSRAGSTEQQSMVRAMVTLTSDAEVAEIEKNGADVRAMIGNTAIVDVALDSIERIAALDVVLSVEFGRQMQPMMDFARPASNVGSLHSGIQHEGETLTFNGTGVVAGLMDVGIDPNHANFRDDSGALRVKRVWALSGANAGTYATPEAISHFTTENSSESHGTHVAGIMAGSYNGTGTYATQTSPTASASGSIEGLTLHTSGKMPFYGIATHSDIAMAAGNLSDANILLGVKNIMDYAKAEGKPAVVNLSLGSTVGPHDGTDTYSQRLGDLGKDGIIILAAGNDGDENISISKKITVSAPAVKTFIAGNATSSGGSADIWSSGSEPLTVSWVIYDSSSKTATTLMTCDSSTGGNYVDIIGTNSEYTQNADFNASFSGYIALTANLDSRNNRYHVSAPANLSPKSDNGTKSIGIIVEGATGITVSIYGQNMTFDSNRVSGWTKGTPDESINDAAGAPNILTVGSYTSRTCWGVLKQGYGVLSNGQTLGEISTFSSYGTIAGQAKPDICAPGSGIISSYSTPYTTAKNINIDNTYSGSTNAYGRNSYWGQMQGTSMACPQVAGIVALMLQADPTLNAAKVKEHLTTTAVKDINVITASKPIRWGAGKADALAAVKAVLQNRAAIGDVWDDDSQRLVITATADGYEVFVAGAGQLTATLYDLQGRPVARRSAAGSSVRVDASALQSGIYILEAATPTLRLTRKVALK